MKQDPFFEFEKMGVYAYVLVMAKQPIIVYTMCEIEDSLWPAHPTYQRQTGVVI